MAARLRELVLSHTLLSDWDLSKHLLYNMWNYSDVSEAFTNHFRDAGVFETLQDILRDPGTRAAIDQDEVSKPHTHTHTQTHTHTHTYTYLYSRAHTHYRISSGTRALAQLLTRTR